MYLRGSNALAFVSVLSLGLVGLSACNDDLAGPDDLGGPPISSVADLQETLDAGSIRVAITIASDGTVARDVEVLASGATDAEASIETTVTGFELQANQTLLLTLAPGNIFVRVSDSTRLAGDHDDELDFGSFVVRLGKALSDGQEFTVRAQGEVSQAPSGSDSLELVASQVSSGLASGEIRLELNIDRNNLELNDAPPPDAWINVLGLRLELRVSTGETALARSTENLAQSADSPGADFGDSPGQDFMGQVESVNLEDNSFVTSEGIVVRLGEDSEIEQDSARGHPIPSLVAVAEVLATGRPVFAAGHGAVESSDPLVILAHHVAFEAVSHGGEFMGQVESVNLEENSFVTTEGFVVRLSDETEIWQEAGGDHLLASLAAVAEALQAGETVFTAGEGVVESSDPMIIRAMLLVFGIGAPFDGFGGEVESVNLADSSFVTRDGAVVRLNEDTEIWQESGFQNDRLLPSLEAVVEALQAGKTVYTGGGGIVESSDPLMILAMQVMFEVQPLHLDGFHGQVESVNLAENSLVTSDGIVVRLGDDTEIWYESRSDRLLPSLAAVAEALESGHPVFTAGEGMVESPQPLVLLAARIVFERDLPLEEFWGQVDSVNLADSSFVTSEGVVVRLDEHTEIWQEFDSQNDRLLPSLEAVVDALKAGKTVFAGGGGAVESNGPLTILAMQVGFELQSGPLEGFHHQVASVNLADNSLVTSAGTVVRLGDDTQIWYESGSDRLLASLAAVAEVLEAGQSVLTYGEGSVESSEPLVLLAVHIVFERDLGSLEGFHHQVASVNLADNSLVTSVGTVVRLGDDTQIWYESGNGQLLLPSLAAVAEVLAAGHSVLTWGEGIIESSAPLVILAVYIAFEQDLPPLEAFGGEVDSVNLAARSFVTSEGVVVRLNEDSQIWHTDGPDLHLGSLEDVAQALEDGKTVLVQGEGIVESTGPLAILAVHLGWELHQTGFTQPSRDR